jgi:mannose-6-phosphate isomerase-like protein (cupin superfamily)
MELYGDLVRQEEDEIRVAVVLTDTGEEATLTLRDKIEVGGGSDEADLKMTMERRIFDEVLRGEADFGALIGRSRMSDVRPINFQFLKPERASAITDALKAMITFFTPGRVKVKELSWRLAGLAHGAHPIPLVYWDGIRLAWYQVRKGEVVNEEGERDSYPQVFIVLKGRGTIFIDETELELRPNTAVYVPINSVHKVKADEDVEAVWFAWKTPP